MRSCVIRAACTAGLLLTAVGVVLAQAPGRPGTARPKDAIEQTIRTADGWTLPITYFNRFPGPDTPVVIMLHGRDGNRLVWKNLATRLQDEGYAVVTVDLRKHGDSQAPANAGQRGEKIIAADYSLMATADMEAIKNFLHDRHQARELNIRKTGIVAADDMATVAVNWALADWLKKPWPDAPTVAASTPKGQDIRAVALLSPSDSAGRLNIGRVLPDLRRVGLAAWIGVGAEDPADKGAAQKSYDLLTGSVDSARDRVFLDKFERVKTRGTELLNARSADVDGRIVKFFNDHLKPLNDKWRDRKSKLAS